MKERKKIENTVGMFDMLKGVMMIIVVFAHNASAFPESFINEATAESSYKAIKYMSFVYELPILPRIIFSLVTLFIVSMMPILLIIGGYGFRKRPVSKSFKGYYKDLLKPYIYTTIAIIICNICIHYAFFRYLPGALKESFKVFISLVLGVSQTISIGEETIYANGPIWFMLAMFWSLIIFNVIINYAKEKFIPYIVFAISIVGWLLSYLKFTPWCLSQGMVAVLYVYMGYRLKKDKFFSREFSLKDKILITTLVFLPNVICSAFGLITEMADNMYSLGPVSYVENGLVSILFLYLILKLNSLRGPISNGLRKIGRYSLYFLCVHTVELIAVPYYKIAEFFEGRQMLGFCIVFVVRMTMILIIMYLVIKVNEMIKKLKEKRIDKPVGNNA